MYVSESMKQERIVIDHTHKVTKSKKPKVWSLGQNEYKNISFLLHPLPCLIFSYSTKQLIQTILFLHIKAPISEARKIVQWKRYLPYMQSIHVWCPASIRVPNELPGIISEYWVNNITPQWCPPKNQKLNKLSITCLSLS